MSNKTGGILSMALKDTIKQMHHLLAAISKDLVKAENKKNKAASQRVRTGSIKLAKIAKAYRKESVKEEKKGGFKKKKAVKKVGKKKAKPAKKRKVAKKKRPAPKRKVKKAKKKVIRKKRRR